MKKEEIWKKIIEAVVVVVEIPPKTRYKQKQNEIHYENITH